MATKSTVNKGTARSKDSANADGAKQNLLGAEFKGNRAMVGLEAEDRQQVARIINTILADLEVLKQKTRNYHWNVTGEHFRSLHLLFEEQYGLMATAADEVAEFSRQYGYPAIGTMQEFLALSSLQEQPGDYPDWETMVRNLLTDQNTVVRTLREQITVLQEEMEDDVAADFVTELCQQHLKMAWMLRALVEPTLNDAVEPQS